MNQLINNIKSKNHLMLSALIALSPCLVTAQTQVHTSGNNDAKEVNAGLLVDNYVEGVFKKDQIRLPAVKAASLLQYYYGKDTFKLNHVAPGPSGTVELGVTHIVSNRNHHVYMLPDGENMIIGTMINPYNYQATTQQKSHLETPNYEGSPLAEQIMVNTLTSDAKQLVVEDQTPDAVPTNDKNGVSSTSSINQALTTKDSSVQSNIKKNDESLKLIQDLPIETSSDTSVLPETIKLVSNKPELATLPEVNRVADKDILWNKIKQSYHITEGLGKKHVYAFIDLNCPACIQSHQVIQPYIESKEITVHWIPVTVKGQDSTGKAAYVLSLDNEKAISELNRLMVNTSLKDLGGVKMTNKAYQIAIKKWAKNTLLLKEMPIAATPTFAYQDKDGVQIMLPDGVKSIKKMINNATNM